MSRWIITFPRLRLSQWAEPITRISCSDLLTRMALTSCLILTHLFLASTTCRAFLTTLRPLIFMLICNRLDRMLLFPLLLILRLLHPHRLPLCQGCRVYLLSAQFHPLARHTHTPTLMS